MSCSFKCLVFLNVTDGNVCYLFEVSNEKIIRMIQPRLYSTHEEADSKLILHGTIEKIAT